jgi:hypothetical protein
MTRQRRSTPAYKDPLKEESPAHLSASKFLLICKKIQCIFCVGNEALSYEQRTRKFRRVSHIWDHVENIHLRKVPAEQRIICHHPIYKAKGLPLEGVQDFKNHDSL